MNYGPLIDSIQEASTSRNVSKCRRPIQLWSLIIFSKNLSDDSVFLIEGERKFGLQYGLKKKRGKKLNKFCDDFWAPKSVWPPPPALRGLAVW